MTLCFSHRKEDPYTRIDRKIVYDSRLTWKAKGLLLYAFSQAQDWKFYRKEMMRHASDGEKSFDSGIKELEKIGYLHKQTAHKANGQLDGWIWHFFEEPISIEEFKKRYRNPQNAEYGETPNTPKGKTNENNCFNELKKTTNEAPPKCADPEPVEPSIDSSSSFSFLSFFGLSAIQIALCEEKYSLAQVQQAVKCVERAKNVQNRASFLLSALKEGYEPPEDKEEFRGANYAYLEKLRKTDGKILPNSHYKTIVGPTYVLFLGTKTDGSDNHKFFVESLDFKKSVLDFVSKFKKE